MGQLIGQASEPSELENCRICGAPKHGTLSNRWQVGYWCGTVSPSDGPTRQGKFCKQIEEQQKKAKRVEDLLLEALVYVEDQLNDPVNKPGVVADLAKRIRDEVK